jgi:hypothetical protein
MQATFPDLQSSKHLPALPFLSPDTRTDIDKILPYLKAGICPFCQGRLKIDDQAESVFAFCDSCHQFDVSVHLDLETREAVLAYSSVAGLDGFVDPETLKSLENVLVRKNYLAF